MSVQRTTRELVCSDWSRNSASRSCDDVSITSTPQLFRRICRAANFEHLTYSLENLFPPNILQPRVQVLDLLHQRLNLVLVRALNPARLANRHIQGELDGAMNACA